VENTDTLITDQRNTGLHVQEVCYSKFMSRDEPRLLGIASAIAPSSAVISRLWLNL
jgi:hypothetical protein